MNIRAYKFSALFFAIATTAYGQLYAASTVAIGDASKDSGKTFTFAVGKAVYDTTRNQLWTVTAQSLSEKTSATQDYALSSTLLFNLENPSDKELTVKQMAPEKVTLITYLAATYTSTNNVANPVRQEGFDQMFFSSYNIGLLSTGADHFYLLSSVNFTAPDSDANKATVYKYTPSDSYTITKADTSLGGVIYSFESAGAFGTDASRLNLVNLFTKNISDKVSQTYLLNYTDGSTEDATPQIFSTSSSFLIAGTSALQSLGSSLTTAPIDSSMYIGCAGQANAAEGSVMSPLVFSSGTTSLVKEKDSEVYTNKSKLTLTNVLLDATAQAAQDSLITAGANSSIAVTNIAFLKTSTGLSYIVVASNTGVDSDLRLACLPLVNMSETKTENGMIADLTSVTKKYTTSGSRVVTAGFTTPLTASNVAQIQQSNATALVGGSTVLPVQKNIAHMYTLGDRVYIVSNNAYDVNNEPGIFATQALFDATGLIASWTPWVRVGGTDTELSYAVHNATFNTIVASSTTDNAGDTISQSVWNKQSSAQQPLLDELNSWSSIGGVQGLFGFSPLMSGSKLSLMVGTGYNKVVVAQTGALNENDQLVPQPVTNDTLQVFDLEGLDLGAIIACDIVINSEISQCWLMVGGSKGVAIYSNDTTGNGWALNEDTFSSMFADGFSWKKVALEDCTFVKKIMHQFQSCYILTRTGLTELILNPAAFTADNPASYVTYTLAQQTEYNGAFFTDFVVNSAFRFIIGTTQGLYQINTDAHFYNITPTPVATNSDIDIVSCIITQSNNELYNQDFGIADYVTNMYVLFSDFASDQSAMQRFCVTPSGTQLLTITPVQDELAQDQITPLLVFNQFKHKLYIDPAGWYISVFATSEHAMTYHSINGTLVSGLSSSSVLLNRALSSSALQTFKNNRYIATTAKDYATGALFVAGSFGVMINS